jgi:hypothetical protein
MSDQAKMQRTKLLPWMRHKNIKTYSMHIDETESKFKHFFVSHRAETLYLSENAAPFSTDYKHAVSLQTETYIKPAPDAELVVINTITPLLRSPDLTWENECKIKACKDQLTDIAENPLATSEQLKNIYFSHCCTHNMIEYIFKNPAAVPFLKQFVEKISHDIHLKIIIPNHVFIDVIKLLPNKKEYNYRLTNNKAAIRLIEKMLHTYEKEYVFLQNISVNPSIFY